jgi:hypothetical protein
MAVRPARLAVRVGLGLVIVVVAVLAVTTLLAKRHASDSLLSFTRHLSEIRASVSTIDAPRARANLVAARADLDQARGSRKALGIRVASSAGFSGAARSYDRFVEGGEQLYAAAAKATDALEALRGRPDGRRLLRDGTVDFALLDDMKSDASGALVDLERADTIFQQVQGSSLFPGMAKAKDVALQQVAQARTDFQGMPAIIDRLPALLARNDHRTYYVSIVNSSELRGSGGGMLVYVLVNIDNGKASVEGRGSIYAFETEDPGLRHPFDYPVLADDFWSQVVPDSRRLGNVGWSPNFPTVGYNITQLFAVQTGGRHLDGVVAATAPFLSLVLDVTGPAQIEGLTEPLTGQNLTRFVIHDAYTAYEQPQRRAINQILLDTCIARLLAGPDLGAFVAKLPPLVKDRSLQAYMTRPDEETLVRQLGLDGTIDPTDRDYGLLVSNNTAGNKNDFNMRHDVDQSVALDTTGLGTETVTYVRHNTSDPNPGVPAGQRLPEYYDHFSDAYVGAYLPGRAIVDGIEIGLQGEALPSPVPITNTEAGKIAVVKGLRVQPQRDGSLTVHYRLADAATQDAHGVWTYHLVRQRSPRLDPDNATVRVTLPPGATVVDGTGWQPEGASLVTTAQIVGTREFTLSYRLAP